MSATTVIQQNLNERQQLYSQVLAEAGIEQQLADRMAAEFGGSANPPLQEAELQVLTDEQKVVLGKILEDYQKRQVQSEPQPESKPVASSGFRALDEKTRNWSEQPVTIRRDGFILVNLGCFIICLLIGCLVGQVGAGKQLDKMNANLRQCQIQLQESLK
ncbi:MAG TPA: hypothetical protein V6D10_07295 [Trichocoleus sp.]|jgi:hypothetical protein